MPSWDVIVVGAGHAGCEAALASARMGCRTLLLTMSLDAIAQMSCNPAIGGTAKGHLVREIDALGGEMGRATDRAAIQMKTLDASRGPAVRSTRAQCDRARYRAAMTQTVEAEPGLDVRQGQAARFVVAGGRVAGVEDQLGVRYEARAVVVTAGTFLRGPIRVGAAQQRAGRAGEFAADDLADALRALGLRFGRLKTGTPPRLRRSTIAYDGLVEQWGDPRPWPFHWATARLPLPQVVCHATYTTPATHAIIRDNLDRSPLYSGVIDATGVRYCPPVEDKVVRFADRDRHQGHPRARRPRDLLLWAAPFLRDVYGLSTTAAAAYASAPSLALLGAGPLTEWVSDRIGHRRRTPYTMLTSGLVGLWVVLVLTLGSLPLWGAFALFFTMGIFGAAFALTWPIGREVNPPHLAGVAVAVVNLGGFLGAAPTQAPLGALLDARSTAALLSVLVRETRGVNVYEACD